MERRRMLVQSVICISIATAKQDLQKAIWYLQYVVDNHLKGWTIKLNFRKGILKSGKPVVIAYLNGVQLMLMGRASVLNGIDLFSNALQWLESDNYSETVNDAITMTDRTAEENAEIEEILKEAQH